MTKQAYKNMVAEMIEIAEELSQTAEADEMEIVDVYLWEHSSEWAGDEDILVRAATSAINNASPSVYQNNWDWEYDSN